MDSKGEGIMKPTYKMYMILVQYLFKETYI